ncbi:MAG TPA: dienelactone hydrolase family protein [Ilumatobacter sp.]|nr:dienelactone hydrolase family protein [Ilumatobacter sp.]
MGTIVDFASTDQDTSKAVATGPRGYLSVPTGGSGPGVLVIQEWWGLDSGIKEMADRLAVAGFVALAPDLYRGELAGHTEMDKAGELMNSMPFDRAAADMSAAVDFLVAHDATAGDSIGVVGFCMGGMLSFHIAANRPDVVGALVPFYGFPSGDGQPDYSQITAAIQGHMAEHDDFFPPEGARALEQRLQGMGLDVTLTVHPGTGHAFMAPHNALGTQDNELYQQIWPQTVAFLQSHLA